MLKHTCGMNERLRIVGGQVLLRRRPRNRVRCIAMDRYKFGTENRKPCQGGRGSAVATRHRRFNPRKKISDRAPPLDSRLEPLDRIIVQESRYRNTHFAFQSVSFVSTFSYLYRTFYYNYYYYLLTMLKFQHFQLCHLNLYKSL